MLHPLKCQGAPLIYFYGVLHFSGISEGTSTHHRKYLSVCVRHSLKNLFCPMQFLLLIDVLF